jgi:hypothetical protein
MSITKEQAMTETRFHENHEPGGKVYHWRANGQCKTWKTRPDDFRLPIKYGLRAYDAITPSNAHMLHAACDCPDENERGW